MGRTNGYRTRYLSYSPSETHTKRQATRHGCLSILLGDGNKWIEIVYGGDKNIVNWANYSQGWTKISCTGTTRLTQRTSQGKILLFVPGTLFFTSVSTVSRGHPSLVSPVSTVRRKLIWARNLSRKWSRTAYKNNRRLRVCRWGWPFWGPESTPASIHKSADHSTRTRPDIITPACPAVLK